MAGAEDVNLSGPRSERRWWVPEWGFCGVRETNRALPRVMGLARKPALRPGLQARHTVPTWPEERPEGRAGDETTSPAPAGLQD